MGHETRNATSQEQLQHWFDKAWGSVGMVKDSALLYFKRVIQDMVGSDGTNVGHQKSNDERDAA